MNITPEPISVLGLGKMGAALASVFLDKGHSVTVWNRKIEKAQPLISKGAKVAESPADCAQSGTLLLISLFSDEVVRDVLSRIPTLRDRTVINFTTSRPQWVIETAYVVTNKLCASGYLHGWINSVPSEVEDQQASVRYSGPEPVFAKHKHICQVLGKALWLSDDHRKICILENAALLMLAGLFVAFFQSLALAGAAGVDRVDFTRHALLPVLPLFQQMLPQMAKRDQDQSHSMSDDSISIGTMKGLVSTALETAETSGVSTRLFDGFHALLRQATKSGKGSEDVSTIIRMLRRGSPQ
jgi:3-hydroxyisobutyrate dehydrogenase-like beta-hydroxyacid dehydrogenase